jgi:hypothetical protein
MDWIAELMPAVIKRLRPYQLGLRDATVERVVRYHLAHPKTEPLTKSACIIMLQFVAARDALVLERQTKAFLGHKEPSHA